MLIRKVCVAQNAVIFPLPNLLMPSGPMVTAEQCRQQRRAEQPAYYLQEQKMQSIQEKHYVLPNVHLYLRLHNALSKGDTGKWALSAC